MGQPHDSLVGELEQRLEAYEKAVRNGGPVRIRDFAPPEDHPEFVETAQELIRLDLEYRHESGAGVRLEDYRDDFAALFDSPELLSPIAFEDFRLRTQAGEHLSPGEYESQYGIDAGDWPVCVPADSCAAAVEEFANSTLAGFAPGQRLLDFELVCELGRGSFSRVFLSRQQSLAQRPVVLKIASIELPEAEWLAQLQHTNIVPIYSLHTVRDAAVICMPYFGSTTLKHVIDSFRLQSDMPESGREFLSTVIAHDDQTVADVAPKQRPRRHRLIPQPESQMNAAGESPNPLSQFGYESAVLWIVRQLADGLAHAHDRGIIHRDLKPANILLSEDGQPMILDFNLSAAEAGSSEHTRIVGGTLPYMSPEQIASVSSMRDGDGRTDLFSLGVILFELLSGKLPYPHRDDDLNQMIEDRWARVPSLRKSRVNVSPATDSIVGKCLSPDPGARYQNAHQLVQDLDRQLSDEPLLHARNPSLRERMQKWARRHPRISSASAVATAALLLIVVIGILWSIREVRLARLEAREVFAEFESSLPSEAFSVPIGDGDAAVVRTQIRAALLPFRVFEAPDWRAEPVFRRLPDEDRQSLTRSVSELRLLLTELGDPSAADLEAPTAEDALRDDEWAHYIASASNVLNRRYHELVSPLTELTHSDSDNYSIWFLLGIASRGVAAVTDAETCFTTCTALQPDSASAWYQRGICRLQNGDASGAREDFTRVLLLNPASSNACVSRALAFQAEENYEAALLDLDEAIERGFSQTRIYFMRAGVLDKLNRTEAAVADRETGLRLTPTDAKSWVARGLARLPDDPEKALADVQEALKASPNSHDALRNMSMILSGYLKRDEEAIEVLNRTVDKYPADPLARTGRGVLLARDHQRDVALSDAEAALNLSREPMVVYMSACIYALTSTEHEADQSMALQLLAESLRKDASLHKLAWTDEDLKPIKERPEFRKLIAATQILQLGTADSTP